MASLSTENESTLLSSSSSTEDKSEFNLLIMRHAERVDKAFPHWTKECITKDGKYMRKDLNMPTTLPKRANIMSYDSDTPLTNVGLLQAKLTGEALAAAGITIKRVYCSPAYRCVQTCNSLLTGMGMNKLPIKIEPGLFEWFIWYLEKQPKFMTDEELLSAGFNIDKTYQSMISRDDLVENNLNENCEQFYTRNYNVVRKILDENQAQDAEYILIVAHGPALETCSRQLMGKEPRDPVSLGSILREIPFCSMVHLQKKNSQWQLHRSPVFSISHLENNTFDYNILINEKINV